ncbi:hypothetical protein ACROYT_G041181, partial [Oculina patagonica]
TKDTIFVQREGKMGLIQKELGFLMCDDLPAVDAVYHHTCSVNFHTKRKLPKVYEVDEPLGVKKRKVGRPQDEGSNWRSIGSCFDGPGCSLRQTRFYRCICICCKNGMQCSPACGQCKGSACTNLTNALEYEDLLE